ncbi:H-NS family nucleoid-associated regulatory protein [Paraburkholderia xenovorans]|uniref:H-NS family nucleoid-associated regulatory protein n=1 Tax=Paraburkholderia xenovorans TaxID=36873 RepID=UPI0038BAFC78
MHRDPKSGATWSGRGRAPSWIAKAKDRSKFLIAGGGESTVATTAGAVSRVKTAVKKASKSVRASVGKGQRKGPQPAMYRDPKSGATWSGRGPAPAWFAGVKDRSKFLIDGAAAVPSETDVVSKASKPKAAGKSGVAAKTVATKKAVGGKSPAAKKAVSKKAALVKTIAAKVEAPTAPNASPEASA